MENKCLESGGAAWEEGGGTHQEGPPGGWEAHPCIMDLVSPVQLPRESAGICIPSQFLPSRVPLRGSSQGDTQTPTPLTAGEHRTTRTPNRKGPDSLRQS